MQGLSSLYLGESGAAGKSGWYGDLEFYFELALEVTSTTKRPLVRSLSQPFCQESIPAKPYSLG